MNNNREKTNKALDKIISTAHDIKRKLSVISDKQCSYAVHQKSHEVIDDRMTRVKKDLELFIHMNSVIDKFLEITGVSKEKFFKKDNLRDKKSPAHDRAKADVVDARKVFCHIFKKGRIDTLGSYLNMSRYTIFAHRNSVVDLLETDKKFQEYYERIIKKL